MAEALTFFMGKFPAVLPGDRHYVKTHLWVQEDEGRLRFGFTSYAVRLMQDVYLLDWTVSGGDAVGHLQCIGHLESSKANADLFAPAAGTLARFNQALLDDPSGINVDPYGGGWLFEMTGVTDTLLTVAEYHQYLTDNWDKTQRMIKGKINTED